MKGFVVALGGKRCSDPLIDEVSPADPAFTMEFEAATKAAREWFEIAGVRTPGADGRAPNRGAAPLPCPAAPLLLRSPLHFTVWFRLARAAWDAASRDGTCFLTKQLGGTKKMNAKISAQIMSY